MECVLPAPAPGLFPGSLSHRNVASQTVSEKEWLEGLNRCQDLKAALEADIDPDTGKLKSLADFFCAERAR